MLLLRCIDTEHQIGERVLLVNSKVMFHRPSCFGGKAVIEMKHPHTKTIKQTCVSAKSGDSTAPGTTTSTTGATSQTSTEGASSDNVNGNNIIINNNDCAQPVALVGGAVGGVAIVIIVALVIVIVVIWKRRCK